MTNAYGLYSKRGKRTVLVTRSESRDQLEALKRSYQRARVHGDLVVMQTVAERVER